MVSGSLTVEDALRQHGFVIHNIKGVSMMPLLDQRTDSVRLERCTCRLSRDDIALFKRSDGSYVLHRVVRVSSDSYLIRGDNCTESEFVRDDQILAVAVGIFKGTEYHSCDEPLIRRYAARQRLTLPFRKLRSLAYRAYRRIRGGLR